MDQELVEHYTHSDGTVTSYLLGIDISRIKAIRMSSGEWITCRVSALFVPSQIATCITGLDQVMAINATYISAVMAGRDQAGKPAKPEGIGDMRIVERVSNATRTDPRSSTTRDICDDTMVTD
jgi:murein DD-endopeptidase MepM/ murein hydrolase activator NlpD